MKHVVPAIIVCLVLTLIGCWEKSDGATTYHAQENIILEFGADCYEAKEDSQGNLIYTYLAWLPERTEVTLLPGRAKTVTVPDAAGSLYEDLICPARLGESRNIFISRIYLFPGQIAGVISAKDRANVYNNPMTLNSTGITLSRRTVVVLAPRQAKDNPKNRWRFAASHIRQTNGQFFDCTSSAYYYVDAADVSTNPSDAEMAQLIQVLESKDKNDVKLYWETIFHDFKNVYGDSIFSDEAQVMFGQGERTVVSERTIEWVGLKALAISDNVEVRSDPALSGGRVRGYLGKGAKVDIHQQTVEMRHVASTTDRWYWVAFYDENKKVFLLGWVFGVSLKLLDISDESAAYQANGGRDE
jgi:hypothetical protein